MITFVLLKGSSVVLKNGLERGKSEGRGQPGKYCQSPEQIIGSEHVAVERSGCYPDIFNKYSKSCGDDWIRGWGSRDPGLWLRLSRDNDIMPCLGNTDGSSGHRRKRLSSVLNMLTLWLL